jgi:hypothetical protein
MKISNNAAAKRQKAARFPSFYCSILAFFEALLGIFIILSSFLCLNPGGGVPLADNRNVFST